MKRRLAVAAVLALVGSAAGGAQQPAVGQLIYDTVHSAALEKNLYGDSPNREVAIYLPPSYTTSPAKRYPVIYLLHGYGGTETEWTSFAPVKAAMDTLVRNGTVREMIVVMPDGNNALGGSFYTNSRTTGNWDDFIAKELVAHVDKKYRTLSRPESRGLAGHSMGGYGTFAVGMRHGGETFGALYAMSGCCTQFSNNPGSGATWAAVTAAQSLADARRLTFIPRVSLALAAAFSANPEAPPLFYNPPFVRNDDKWVSVDSVYRQWVEHAPLDMIKTHVQQLKQLHGFVFDVGTSDQLVAPAALAAMDGELTRVGVTHTYETYDGDHSNRIAARLAARLLPFFSRTLDFAEAPPR
jgi:S-formylglutathione hydrolase